MKNQKWNDRLFIGVALTCLLAAVCLSTCGCRIGPDPEPTPQEAPELPDNTGIPMDAPEDPTPVDPDNTEGA